MFYSLKCDRLWRREYHSEGFSWMEVQSKIGSLLSELITMDDGWGIILGTKPLKFTHTHSLSLSLEHTHSHLVVMIETPSERVSERGHNSSFLSASENVLMTDQSVFF